MPVVDTSVLLAVLDGDDAHHARARSLAAAPSAWKVPTVALLELVEVARRRAASIGENKEAHAQAAAAACWGLQGVQEVSTYDLEAARTLYQRRRTLSYADAIIIATAWHHGDTLLTFDKRQERAWKQGPS